MSLFTRLVFETTLVGSFILLVLVFAACKDDPIKPPPPDPGEITLTLEDVDFTEVVLRVIFPDSIGSWTLSLRRDGKPVRTMTAFRRDTLLKDDGLEPSRTYTYQVVRLIDSTTVREKSNVLHVGTKEVTSSAFQWRIDSLGGYTSSTLYDVTIVNDTLVYAVGELYLPGESKRYNLAVWNGTEWKIQRLTYFYQGIPTYPVLYTVFAFGPNDIWFGGEGIYHWDGRDHTFVGLPQNWGPNVIKKVWGSSPSDLYMVGDNGSIAHYNGSTWQKIESGTTLPIRGLYGAKTKDNEYEILCVADSYMEPEGSKVISIKDDKATTIWNDRRDFGLDAIWFIPGKRYIVVGDGFWETDSLSKPFTKIDVLTSASKTSIHGIDNRDIVVAGAFKLLAHFNGYKWTSFFPFSSGAFGSVKIKENLIVAVGLDGRYAIAVIGKR